ncbi:MAG: hypothetical protein WBQ86_15385 [Candidatus Binatus sp.]
MDELKRRLQIAAQIADWGNRTAEFIHAAGKIGRRADVSNDDKQELKEAAENVGKLFRIVADMVHKDPKAAEFFEQMTASLERLNEELIRGNSLLEKIANK